MLPKVSEWLQQFTSADNTDPTAALWSPRLSKWHQLKALLFWVSDNITETIPTDLDLFKVLL